jgi:hypothetical protein
VCACACGVVSGFVIASSHTVEPLTPAACYFSPPLFSLSGWCTSYRELLRENDALRKKLAYTEMLQLAGRSLNILARGASKCHMSLALHVSGVARSPRVRARSPRVRARSPRVRARSRSL